MQREWEEALENYNKAIDWNEKTGQEFELGGTYTKLAGSIKCNVSGKRP